MEHMPKSTQRVGGYIFRNFVTKKKEGVPQAIFEKYHVHGTFLFIIMLKFVSNIR